MKKRPPTPRTSPRGAPAKPAAKPAAAAPPSPREPTYDDILAIARLIEAGSRFSEFRLKSGDIEVEVKRGSAAPPQPGPIARPREGTAEPPRPSPRAGSEQPRSAAANDGAESPAELPRGSHVIRSPMVGTFYRSPDPAAAPFVEQGSRVKPDDIVCIIEVMKLMNSVSAGVTGVVTHVFVENAQMVEHGQPLVAIREEP
jgi:acetyl-CoA carboxylase biotin carboxyl carrier protein